MDRIDRVSIVGMGAMGILYGDFCQCAGEGAGHLPGRQ